MCTLQVVRAKQGNEKGNSRASSVTWRCLELIETLLFSIIMEPEQLDFSSFWVHNLGTLHCNDSDSPSPNEQTFVFSKNPQISPSSPGRSLRYDTQTALKPGQLCNCWSRGWFLQKAIWTTIMAITAVRHLNWVDLEYNLSQSDKKSFFWDSRPCHKKWWEGGRMKKVFQSIC